MAKSQYFPRLFSVDNAKAAKASGYGYLNAIHYMAPANLAGVGNLCPKATEACKAHCLGWFSGHASMVKDIEKDINSVRQSRIEKARLFMTDRNEYMNRLTRDIVKICRKAKREGLKPCIRLNGSTDIAFERIAFKLDNKSKKALGIVDCADDSLVRIVNLFPRVQFVEYTKIPERLDRAPDNLSLTLSYSGENAADCAEALANGHNVAVVFGDGLPETFLGAPVISGDNHDLRHLDPRGCVIGLTPKGRKAQSDRTSGFVLWSDQLASVEQFAMPRLAA